MKNRNFKNKAIIAAMVALASLFSLNFAQANVIVDPKGHDPVQLERDVMECRNLANSIDFNMAQDHQGRSVLRGAAAAGGFAAIAGGNKEVRRRSMGAGALAGGLAKNKSKRVDGSLEEVKRNDAQRNCLIGRGYNPIS